MFTVSQLNKVFVCACLMCCCLLNTQNVLTAWGSTVSIHCSVKCRSVISCRNASWKCINALRHEMTDLPLAEQLTQYKPTQLRRSVY